MKKTSTGLEGVFLLSFPVYPDARGHFREVWKKGWEKTLGLEFVQENASFSKKGVLRGLHHQWPHPQAKLVVPLCGEIFDVAADVRRGSSTFGKWVGVRLSAKKGEALFIPEGFAHGFLALEDSLVVYFCSRPYHPESERTLAFFDPDIGISWPFPPTCVSEKDARAKTLFQTPQGELPVFSPKC